MKKLFLITGPLGVGKTTVSADLAKELGAALVIGDELYNLEEETGLEWEEKLQKAWSRILPEVKKYIDGGQDVVLDFVIEDELPQIRKSFPDSEIYWVVLLADKKALSERLEKRGEIKYMRRSLELLEILGSDSASSDYSIDTTNMKIPEVVQEILSNSRRYKKA